MKAAGGTSNRIRACGSPPGENGEPPVIGALRGRGDDAQGDLALEHQGQPIEERRPGLGLQPAGQEPGADVVGEIGADPDRRPAGLGDQRFRLDRQGVGGDDLKAAGPVRADLGERRQGAFVALDRDHGLGALGEQRAGQAAGAGTDLDDDDSLRAGRLRARSWPSD